MGAVVMQPTDEDLVARLASRDEEAVELLLERYWARAFRVALQLTGGPGAAEDVAQETFLKVLKSAGSFEAGRSFRGWFFAILKNTAHNHTRGARRARGRESVAARPEAVVETAAEQRDEATVVRRHVGDLAPNLRDVLVLHYLEGLTLKDVAEALGCPLGTVKSRRHRGLEQLRTSLSVVMTVTTATLVTLLEAGWTCDVPSAPSAIELAAQADPDLDPVDAPVPPTAEALMAATQPAAAGTSFGIAAAVVLLALGAGIVSVLMPEDPPPLDQQARAPEDDRVPGPSPEGSAPRPPATRGEPVTPPNAEPAPAQDAPVESGTLLGRVVNGQGTPIAGAPVAESWRRGWGRGAFVRSDADGRFTLEGLRGESTLLTWAPGYAEARTVVTVPTKEPALIVLGPGGAVRGRVVDVGGAAVQGARIVRSNWGGKTLQNSGFNQDVEAGNAARDWKTWEERSKGSPAPGVGGLLSTLSGADGSFALEHLPAGLNRLLAWAPGHGLCRADVTIDSGRAHDVEMRFVTQLGSLTGVVLGVDGKPLVGADVSIDLADHSQRSVTTDDAGRFAVQDLPVGPAEVEARFGSIGSVMAFVDEDEEEGDEDGLEWEDEEGDGEDEEEDEDEDFLDSLRMGRTVVIVAGKQSLDFDFAPGRVLLDGVIRFGDAALEGAFSLCFSAGGTTRYHDVEASKEGRFAVHVDPGAYNLTWWVGRNSFTRKLTVPDTPRAPCELICPEQSASISGTVHDAEGNPINQPGVIVFDRRRVRGLHGHVFTWQLYAGEGRTGNTFEFKNLPAGHFRVQIGARGFAVKTQEVVVRAREALQLAVTLRPGAHVAGVVVGPDGRPRRATVAIRREGGEALQWQFSAGAPAGDDGRFRMDGVEPGTYILRAFSDDGHAGRRRVTVGPAGAVGIQLDMAQSGALTVKVMSGGKPVVGAELGLVFPDGEPVAMWGRRRLLVDPSGADGLIQVQALMPGSYEVFVEKDDVLRQGTVVVRSGQTAAWTVNLGSR